MLQDILTYTSVIAAFGYAAHSFWQIMFSGSAQSGCGGGGCSSCGDKAFIMKAAQLKRKELLHKPR